MANNPRHKENLKPFKKGDDPRRNLKGAPKLPDLKKILAESLSDEKDGKNQLEQAIEKLRKMALSGNLKAMQLLLEYAYGKPMQYIESSSTIAFESQVDKLFPPLDEVLSDD